jgi:hypothetical protein
MFSKEVSAGSHGSKSFLGIDTETLVSTDGRRERVIFDKITARISRLAYGLNLDFVDPAAVAQKVINNSGHMSHVRGHG